MWNAGLDEAQTGIKISRGNINNLRYADDTTLMTESEEEPLDESERGDWKVGLKLNIQKTKIMASGPITSWQIDGETMETVTDFIFLGSKITAGGDCSREIKTCLLLGRKAMTNLDSILKSRDITLPTKVHLIKAMVFSSSHVWMWELDVKKSEHRRIDAFKQWCWRRKTLESPLDYKEIQSIHPEGNQFWIFIGWGWCWSWSSNTLSTCCKKLTPWKSPWYWERLKAGGEGDDRRWDGWMASPSQWIWIWASSGSWWWTGKSGVLQSIGLQRVGHDWTTELTELSNKSQTSFHNTRYSLILSIIF